MQDNTDVFEAHNVLETQLLQAQEGLISGEEFMHELLAAQVFMPIYSKHRINGFQESQQAQPLSLKAEDGTEVLTVFTSPERAKPFVQDYPGYEAGLLVEFKWILEKMGSRQYGIALNPGWSVGLDLEPEMLEQLKQVN